jgi:AcrR family transcriptional regulator
MNRQSKKNATGNKGAALPSSEELLFASTRNALLVESKHQQIVNGACKVFFKKGFHPTTIRDIAKASGMSMGQLYHYIHSKDDVLYLVHKHLMKIWYDYLKRSGFEQIEDDDPVMKLRDAFSHTVEFMIEHKELVLFIFTESKYLDRKHLRMLLDVYRKHINRFWRGLLEGLNIQDQVVTGDLDTLAGLAGFTLLFPPLAGWTVGGKLEKRHLDTLVEFSMRGFGIGRGRPGKGD